MSDPVRVLVTGSRFYPNTDRVREAITDVEYAYQMTPLVLVHGACDPRHPTTRARIPWHVAMAYPFMRRLQLLGGDWLAAQIAADHGWASEAHPADWAAGKQAGFQRNAAMIGLGADVVIALTEFCEKPDCTRRRGAHITHGTDHCARMAELARIKTWRYPA